MNDQQWKLQKPKSFDFNLIVIGAGAAGLVSSYIAAAVKAKVLLVEGHRMGGDCLNTGCVPSKAILRSAKIAQYMRNADKFGLEKVYPKIEFSTVMSRVHEIIAAIEPHDSVERYESLGVNCEIGVARFISPWMIEVNGKQYSARHIIIATGAKPYVPHYQGLSDVGYLTSDSLWDIKQSPERLLVLGGGPIGCELAQAFARLGSQVKQMLRSSRLMGKEDADVSDAVMASMREDGIDILTNSDIVKFEKRIENGQEQKWVIYRRDEQLHEWQFDQLLIATGRQPNTSIEGLDALPVTLNDNGSIKVDQYLRTDCPNIYACGDVVGHYQFTHTAAHQAWFAAVNCLFGHFKKFKVDYRVIPWATFTDPEVATVGLTETAAKESNIAYVVTKYGIDDLDRAIADSSAYGFVKVLTVPKKDKILGVTIVGHHAGDLLSEYVLAMKHNIGLNKILGTIHIYPTLAESNKYVAGEWKRANAPQGILRWIEKYHRWRR